MSCYSSHLIFEVAFFIECPKTLQSECQTQAKRKGNGLRSGLKRAAVKGEEERGCLMEEVVQLKQKPPAMGSDM